MNLNENKAENSINLKKKRPSSFLLKAIRFGFIINDRRNKLNRKANGLKNYAFFRILFATGDQFSERIA